ncbi:hypothetical protein [Plebeiibacterium marinum]|uniref:Uncharacterized protein n=1 Tax=Plebeiibacterium marinum TaxID=2992111 RepID=A0AAE3MCE6_9BACT|nr:hypothetical protein [Plebeiobacterium marinum]MCW3804944.1 hypothetical protein [Plebeiobacterium marinum]
MKSKHNQIKKNGKSSYNEFDERNGLKPVKSKSGKSKRISIYDDLDEEIDFNNDDYFIKDLELEEDDLDEEESY